MSAIISVYNKFIHKHKQMCRLTRHQTRNEYETYTKTNILALQHFCKTLKQSVNKENSVSADDIKASGRKLN